jgi:hypothetical protein
MHHWGISLMTLGVGAFVLPMFGMQFRIMNAFGDSVPVVASCMAVAGVALVGLSYRREN